jgi:hypothetical protein
MKHVLAWLTRWLLRAAAALGPEEKSEWIEAVLAEVESIEKPWEALRWAWGAFFFACRCRILVALGIVQENIIMNKTSAAYVVIFLAVMGVLSAMPSFRDAATDALGPAAIRLVLGLQDGTAVGEGELRRMAIKAERRHDASTMAFVAMRLNESSQAMQLGKKAIAMDPSLTWIEYFVIKNSWSQDARRTTFGPEVHEVIAADPDNALGYLLLASWLRRTDESLSTHRSEWEEAMGTAFSAGRYDDYLNRRLHLDRDVARDRKLSPFEATWSMLYWPFPEVFEIKPYSDQLIASGDMLACARAARFGAMLQGGQTDVEGIVGQDIRVRALGVLEKKFDLALVAPKGLPPARPRDRLELLPFSLARLEVQPFSLAAAVVVQTALLISGLAGLLVAGCTAALILRWGKSAMLERLVRVAAITGVAATIAAIFAYMPFTFAYSSYLHAQTAREAYAGSTSFVAFGYLPSGLNSFFTTSQGHVYLWSVVIFMGAAAMVWRLLIHAQRARTRPA